MNVLGFDTATAATAACVLRADGQAFEVEPEPVELARPPAHARELLPAIERVLREAGVDWGELHAVAVGVGPGTFTGLRIGVATAQGLARAHRLPLHAVSSLAALAAGIEARVRLPAIDAKRGELFAALYQDGRELVAPLVCPPEELAERVGTPSEAVLAAGDGALRFSEALASTGIRVAPEGSRMHVVRALHVCRLARAAPPSAPEAVVPHYLRAPDAKPPR